MKILFLHRNHPAQFGPLARHLEGLGWEVVFATMRADARSGAGRVVRFKAHRPATKDAHRYLRSFEEAVIAGQGFARAALKLRAEGFSPDIVMAHSGWIVGAFAKDVWPQTRFIPYFEWRYRWPAVDATPYDRPQDAVDAGARNRVRNAPFWLDFDAADAALCPTRFQAAQFPGWMRERLTVIHDGVDTDVCSPGEGGPARARLGIPADAELVTSLARGMEPHRGFPEILRALAILQKRRPRLHAVIVGEDRVAYGAKLPEGESWKARMLADLDFDLSRIRFAGLIPRREMIELFRASDAHLYLTVPFVLSWSMLEAMSAGCLLVASDAEPVREFATDKETALLTPNEPEAVAARVAAALDAGPGARSVREAARRRIVETLDAKRVIFPAKTEWLRALAVPQRETVSLGGGEGGGTG